MRRLLAATSGSKRSLVARICSATEDQFLLRAKVPDSKLLVGLLVFSRAVWNVRWDCAFGCGGSVLRVQSAIVNTFLSYYHHRFKWVVRDRDLERRCFEALLRSLPANCTTIYTDGSSFGNPGPAGSGVFITNPDGVETTGSYYLGFATNAYAEVHAILMATRLLLSAVDDRPVHIFVDNRQAVSIATGRSSGWWCRDVASEIRFNLRVITASRSVYFFWVPGHAKIPGNERADALAKAGARQEGQQAPLGCSARYARSVCDWGYEDYTEEEGVTSASETEGLHSPLSSPSLVSSPSLPSSSVATSAALPPAPSPPSGGGDIVAALSPSSLGLGFTVGAGPLGLVEPGAPRHFSPMAPVRPAASVMAPTCPSSARCGLLSPLSAPSCGKVVSVSAGSGFLLPAPSLASDGKRGRAAPSPLGMFPSVGSGSRGGVETVSRSPRLFSSDTCSRLVAGVGSRPRYGQISPLSLHSCGDGVSGGAASTALTSAEPDVRSASGLLVRSGSSVGPAKAGANRCPLAPSLRPPSICFPPCPPLVMGVFLLGLLPFCPLRLAWFLWLALALATGW